MRTIKIGFICTGNSARSQIAEGFAKHFAKKFKKPVEIYSAGSCPAGYIHKLAVKVMKERGIDISSQKSKSLQDIPYKELDLIVTLCSDASESCPVFPGQKVIHWDIADPASYNGPEDEQIMIFRTIRNTIEKKVRKLIREI